MRRLQVFCVSAVLLLTASGAAQAAQSSNSQAAHRSMGPAVGARTEIVYDGGAAVSLWLKADGTFDMTAPDGTAVRGDWLADDRHVCMIVTEPAPPAGPPEIRCEAAFGPGRTFGQAWSVTDSHGDPVTITIHRDD